MNTAWTLGLVTLVWAAAAFLSVGTAIWLTGLIDWFEAHR